MIVEDGTGLANANAYVSLDQARTYWTDRARPMDGNDALVTAAILRATAYVDTMKRWKGARLKAEQSLEFPRAGLFDWSGLPVFGVPIRVRNATCELVPIAMEGDVFEVLARGGSRIVSESVGPISVSYGEGEPEGRVFQAVERMLAPYVWGEPDDPRMLGDHGPPAFREGQFRYPGGA